jgi:LPXTG-motif cell wall-anchored protein
MPFVLIFVGLVYWLNFVARAWAVSGNPDNYALVSSYTSSAILGLWLMVAGGFWLLLRKR